jgi:hypothetical protein
MRHAVSVSDPEVAQGLASAAEAAVLAACHRQRPLAELLSAAVSRADAVARMERALRSLG